MIVVKDDGWDKAKRKAAEIQVINPVQKDKQSGGWA